MYETREREGITAFQGRNAERAHVRDWLSGGANAPPLFLVHGPAGIGKSRFLRHVTDEAKAQGWQVASAYCEAYLGARPLQPFRQIAQGLAVDMAGLGDVLASAVRLLLVIDDWQWADDASRDRLADLLDAVGDGVKILLASRDAEVGFRSESGLLLLPPLGREEILVTIDSLLRSPDSFAAQRIEQASGGSPLLIEELCHAFAAGIETAGQDPRGAWFDHAVQTRFERLGADEKALLKLSAVIGHRAPAWLLDALLGQRLAPERLAQLQAADFLFADESGGLYRFKHGLTRDAVYASIGLGERRSLHGDVLLALEAGAEGREGLLDALAYHAVAAGNADKGLPYAIEAGDAALAMGALDRAQAHYRAGFDLAQAIGDETTRRAWVWSFLNKYGLACIVDPAPDQLPMLERAQALLQTNGSPREAMRSAYWLGSIAYGVGMGKRSVRHLRAALSHAETCGTAQDVRLIATKLAHSLFASGHHTEAIAQFEALLPDLRHISRRNDRELAAYAHACFAFLNSERGDYARADRLFVEADALLADPDSAMNASVHLYRAAALVTQGAWDQVIWTTNAVLAVSQRSRARMQDRTSRAQAAYARWQMSRDQEAVEALERAASLFLVPGNSLQHASMVFGWMVDVMAAQNDADKARLYMAEIVRRIRVGGDRLGEAMAWRALSRMAQAQDDAARADRMLGFARRSAFVRLSRREAAHNLVCEAHLRRARGQGGEADQLLTTAAEEFATMGMPFFKAQASALANR